MVKSTRIVAAVLFGLLAAPASAQDAPTLKIYTDDGFAADWAPTRSSSRVLRPFAAGFTVEWIAADSSIGTLRRVQLEGDTTPKPT